MPRVTSRVARKADPAYGIKVGDRYYMWKFRYGGKHKSLKPPKQSQLTQREDYGALRRAQEVIDDQDWSADRRESLADAMTDVIAELEAARDAAQGKYDNLPENWQQGEKGQTLETFVSECEDTIAEIDTIKEQLADSDTDFEDVDEPSGISWPQET
jgi:multidrug efflux pump subunit AcrA (membrane-fusion protein)